jgi:hypothetical protein
LARQGRHRSDRRWNFASPQIARSNAKERQTIASLARLLGVVRSTSASAVVRLLPSLFVHIHDPLGDIVCLLLE